MKYRRFFAMIATSTVVMLGLMYLNTYLFSHVFWSETRAYMAILMGATMAIVMLAFMLSMYTNRAANAAIFIGAALLFGGSLWLVRGQATVQDRSYMSAMIPHHSIAIMTSTRAGISDPRVRKLADEIIFAQDKEIAEMRYLISDIGRNGDGAEADPAPATIVSLEEALSTAEVSVLDPEFMRDEEMGQLFAGQPDCIFTYTRDSHPVLAVGNQQGSAAALLKISGDLVRLSPDARSTANAPVLSAPGITLRVSGRDGGELASEGPGESVEADLVLSLERGLTAGYSGYYTCRG
ncbi:DUF305 domain-containing protein [Thalassobaculum salexigens]|uniref:DUF305 domain-containing protein n=1 Tax=Thalassobaculum salexigens TaxID=455360 RepID=UPI00248D659B|nr:DUF305 domain-containing protein [Thalassobaculum salexigens]